jgi:serine protease Do
MKKFLSYLFVGVLSASMVLLGHRHFTTSDSKLEIKVADSSKVPAAFVANSGAMLPSDAFVQAAAISMPGVVHITTTAKRRAMQQNPFDLFDFFFGNPAPNRSPQNNDPVRLGSGSGVIISADGYIVTNNHVIDGAEGIEVGLHDNRIFQAKLIGTDPSTDLAVIKIDLKGLKPIEFADSDDTKVGQWVLAVGNPFNLASTVTAGIISAKGRNINLLQQKAGNFAIESFIQTDAAVNPGNSGGALVDLSGNLIGINTAIASPSGVYAGYSFAIPSNLVKKVVEDLIDFGIVQRGFLGITMGSVDDKIAKDLNLDKVQGAYISDVQKNSGADEAGLRSGDIITRINDRVIKTSPELQEMVARYRPGDKIQVEYLRDGKKKTTHVTLKGRDNSTKLASKEELEAMPKGVVHELGIELEEVPSAEARKMGVSGGLRIKAVKEGILKANTNIKEGFVITGVNNRSVRTLEDLENVLKNSRGEGVLLQGKYPNESGTRYYAFGF